MSAPIKEIILLPIFNKIKQSKETERIFKNKNKLGWV